MAVKVTWRGDKVVNDVKRAGNLGLYEWGEHVLEESQRRVPHDTGDLERDSRVRPDENKNIVVVSYGEEAAANYAVVQHEDKTLHHPQKGEAKFLETAVKEESGHGVGFVAVNVKKVLS